MPSVSTTTTKKICLDKDITSQKPPTCSSESLAQKPMATVLPQSLNSVTGLSSVIRSEDKTVPVRPGSSYLSFVSSSPAERCTSSRADTTEPRLDLQRTQWEVMNQICVSAKKLNLAQHIKCKEAAKTFSELIKKWEVLSSELEEPSPSSMPSVSYQTSNNTSAALSNAANYNASANSSSAEDSFAAELAQSDMLEGDEFDAPPVIPETQYIIEGTQYPGHSHMTDLHSEVSG
ncbi:hypothetical protein EB796_023657 [Bugula neritina]|uniref:Uncharacterized protein n=1 Tax=Bugula neritina TaxID=10212 RepID=A0A7J7IXB6_BUGNE|nr:hypothetical protein EB796_023657 [Bugula neritina]